MTQYSEKWPRLNVSLCHDWLTGMRGGERVLELLCDGFPSAPLYSLIHNPSAISPSINAHPIHTSFIQHIPGIFSYYRNFLPLFPCAIESMHPPKGTDLIISTSHCVAKGIKPPAGAKHICYCFTPMRYAWTFYDEYFGAQPIKSLFAKQLLPMLRSWDKKSCDRVDVFVAISKHVQKRIMDFYGRESDIVYPPVDTERLTPGKTNEKKFDLIVSAMVPYKRIDLAVKAYNRLGYPLKIVGIGGELKKLKAIAKDNIEFLNWQPDEIILDLYRSCRMLVFPGEEDFGIVPLEAQSCGRPVVAYARGGALETVVDNNSGIFFNEQTESSLIQAIETCASREWDPESIRAHAENFSTNNFLNGIAGVINKLF